MVLSLFTRQRSDVRKEVEGDDPEVRVGRTWRTTGTEDSKTRTSGRTFVVQTTERVPRRRGELTRPRKTGSLTSTSSCETFESKS